MLPLPRGAVWQLLFLFCAALYINGVRADGRVVCYYTNWSVYRPGTAKFNPQNINPYLCTHLIYAFGGFTKDNQMKPFDKYQDIEQGGYAKFTGLKTYNKQLKTMIAIGGWNEASSRFSPLVANSERRQKFIKNILKFLRQNHFDGIDLDWEYPAHREGGKPRDRDNYAQFVQELRAEFERESEKTGRPRLLLTMAVPAGIEYIEKGYDIPKLNKYLDWFNLLTYDFHSSHEPSVNHHAPLYSLEEESEYNYDAELNIDYSIKFYLNAGADRDKLVLGIPTYGRSFTLINEESTEIGAPAEAPGDQGDATREKGYLAYYEICQNVKEDPEWTVVQPNPNAMGPYAYRRNQWVGFDDEAIVRKKAQYVVDNGLGGIMFWAIDNDDFRGTCTGKPYPLIEAAKDAMLDALGLGINEVSKPSAPQKPSRSRSRENSSSTRNRITTTEHKLTYAERKGSSKRTQSTQQTTRNRQQSTTTAAPLNIKLTEAEGSSLYVGGRTTTPPPPTTPDPGTDFKCEEEGFFQHPRDCKKYYWCLDSGPSGLGIVAHQFTCPSGLYFNPAADSCDFARNVPCKSKKSTTAPPITSPATTTTARPTSSFNRITAATSRPTTFFRTTPRTTTTTEAPEEEIEYEEEDDNPPSPFAKPKGFDKESEEDPKVIKELIELIRKVGGIEELEKHLLRKDDGTIAIKENSSSSSTSLTATTPSSISKSLYEKVLSKPNALSSFRNRFTSTSSFRTTKTQVKAQDSTEAEDAESHETDSKSSGATAGFSKYSSVLRGNSRQGPQSEGLEKISEFDGFLKEKKQYTTINRNRGVKKTSTDEEEEDISSKTSAESHEDDEAEEEVSVKSTRRPYAASTPAYSTIRRTRPSTTTLATDDEEQEEKDVSERKSYSSLNRSRVRGTTTTELPDVTEVTAGSSRYKYLERTRPTRPTTESSNKVTDEEDIDDDNESENQENTVHLKAVNIENTRETQQEITTNTQRTYASIGRRTTTSTTATPETETTTSAAKTRLTTTTAATPTTTSTTETPLTTPLTILETTTPESILITTNIPITTTTNPTTTTTSTTKTTTTNSPNDEDVLESLTTTTPPNPNEISSDISESFNLSQNINSLLTDSTTTTSSSNSTPTPTTESGLDTNEQEIDSQLTTTETTLSTTTTINDSDNLTKTEDKEQEEVNLVSKQRNKTLYTTRTRTTTTTLPPTTTTNSVIETTPSPTNAKKPLGVRRQQILLNRSSQTKTTTSSVTTTDIPTTTTTESVNNDFLGTVSSPRPFGFPKRRNRPTNAAGLTTTEESVVKSNDESLVTKQKTTKLNAAANSQTKVSSHNTILSQTATAQEAATSSQQEHVQQEESEVTSTEHLSNSKLDTKVEHFNKHVVVTGIEDNNDNNLRHVNNVNVVNVDSINNSAPKTHTHTIVQEVDDDDDEDPKKLYTWRDARQPTKPTPKKKKLVVTEVTTEERVRQRVSPDHVSVVNVVATNEKDSRYSKKQEDNFKETGKYRGKSLESSVDSDSVEQNHVDDEEEEGRAFRTYTSINRRHQQTTSQSAGIGSDEETNVNGFRVTQVVKSGGDSAEDSLKSKYNTITRGQTIKTGESESSQESEDGLKTKFKYTTLTRGSQHSGSLADNDENDDKQTKTSFKYTKIIRGQDGNEEESTGGNNSQESDHELKTKYTTVTRGSTAKTVSGSQTSNDESNTENNDNQTKTRFNYTKITRGQGSESVGNEEEDKTASNFGSNSSQEGEDGLKTKFKYSTITRGSTTDSGSQANNDESDDNQTTRFKYTKITRGQGFETIGHEEETSDDSSVTNKRKYTTLNRGHSAEDNSNNAETDGTTKSKTTFQYTKITRGHGSQAAGSEEESSSSQANDDSTVTNKYKYTTLNRGHSAEGNSNNAETDDTTNTSVQYTKITRGHNKYDEDTEGANDETKTYTTLNRNRGSSLYSQDNSQYDSSESDSGKKSYTTITRNRGSGTTTENIPYKAIVRDSQGVHLTEGELSGFVKHAGDAAVTETSERTYHTISRGGQILETGSNEETEDRHVHVDALETMSLTQIEKTTENQQDQAKEALTAEIEEEQSSTTESETTTTTEKPAIITTTTEATTTTTEATTTTEKELPSSTEEVIIENTTVYVAPETTTTTPEPTTRRSFFKNRVSTETNVKETEAEVENSTRGKTKQQEQEVTATQTGRRRVVFRKRPTSVASQSSINRETVEDKQDSEDTKVKQVSEGTSGTTQTQTSFRRRTIVAKRPTLTEDSEAKLKFDHGSLLNTATESSVDDLDSTTRPSLPRGTYRPKEKGDLSSLLALDYAKKYGNKSQQQFVNGKRRRPVERTQSVDENEEDSVTRTRISGSTSEEIVSNKSQQQFGNGKRRRPVQRPQSADENEEDSISRTRITGSTSEEINFNGGSSTITTKKRIFSSKTSESGTINSSETTENSQLKSSGSALKGDTETLIDESSGQSLNGGDHETAEKSDVSSLLASDVTKNQGNKSQFAFGNGAKRISQVQTSTVTGSETENNGKTRINSSTNQQGSSVTETVNGRRRTIIRKRIQSTKTAGTGNALGSKSTLISANHEGNSELLLKHSGHNENESTVSSGTSSGIVSKFNSNTDEKQSNILENSNTTSETSSEHQTLENNDDSSTNSNTKSKFNLNAKQATGTLKTNTYNSLNRNAFANKRVTGSQTVQNTKSGKENTVTETETIETIEEESVEDQNSLNNNISSTSGSKFKSRNSLTSQTPENARKSNFSGRRGSLNTRLQNKNDKTEKVEILEDGSKRITTTYIETINVGGKVKTVKRTKIKTIIQEAPEYEYETDETPLTATTRRPIPLNRGSARFQSNDLSSLLALDFASKSNKHVEVDRTLTKTRRKLIRKPAIVKEEEHIEEFEEDLPTRPTRPASTTEAPQGINRRTRPTRPLKSSTRTTQTAEEDNEEEEEVEKVVATTRRNFALKRPTARPTTRSPVTKETVKEVESTTRRAFAFKRPVGSVKTITTTTTNEEISEDDTTTKRAFAFKRPVGSVKTITTTTTNEQTTEDDSTTKRTLAFKRPVGSVKTITTTTTTKQISDDDATAKRDFAFKRPASSGRTITTTEEISKTSITESEQGNESLNLFKSKTATATEATEELSTTTKEPVTTESSTSESTTPETTTEQYIETTTVPQLTHDPLDTLKNQLAQAVQSLKTETEKVTETEVMDAFETKNEITSGLTSGQDLSLPIYHRRKYYQYYKDSPIIHINPITPASDTAVDTNVDIAKQIHEVFNVSNDHFQPEPEPDDVLALKAMEQAQEINAELSHFLLNTPGSK